MDEQPAAQQPASTQELGQNPVGENNPPGHGESMPQNTTPNLTSIPPAPRSMEVPKWPFVLFVVLLIAALGGGYILYQRAQTPVVTPGSTTTRPSQIITTPQSTPQPALDEQTRLFGTQSQSDEVSTIDSDLNATDLSQIDSELGQVDQEASGL